MDFIVSVRQAVYTNQIYTLRDRVYLDFLNASRWHPWRRRQLWRQVRLLDLAYDCYRYGRQGMGVSRGN